MTDPFKKLVDNRLSGLEWRKGNLVMDRIHSITDKEAKKRPAPRSLKVVLPLCVLLALVSATALAIGLQYSARYSAVQSARNAVIAQYDLSEEALDLFSVTASQEESRWTVRFTPHAMNTEAIGTYVATVAENGTATAAWSHDGADPEKFRSGDLTAPVWGAAQLDKAMALNKAYSKQISTIDWEKAADWTLAERAAMDQMLTEAYGKNAPALVNTLPSPEDIQEADAVKRARDAVIKKYGIGEETLQFYRPHIAFVWETQTKAHHYRITLVKEDTAEGIWDDYFMIELNSPSGEVTRCLWRVDPSHRSLPEGDLAGYADAVWEYVQSGAFDLASTEGKADIARRIQAAGYGDMLPTLHYIAPGSCDISESDALSSARDALLKAYGFTEETLALFAPQTALAYSDPLREWVITYSPVPARKMLWDYTGALGVYTVTLNAKDGAVLQTAWSLEDLEADSGYTKENWGMAKAYSARMLPWLMELLDARDAILQRYPEDENADWLSVEDAAAYDQLFLNAGFEGKQYIHGLPAKSDLDQEKALSLAKQALQSERGLAEEWLAACELQADFLISNPFGDPGQAVWVFTFYRYDETYQDTYTVFLDAETGALERLTHDPAAGGNG